jgi:transaldolase / glucose-6-phosphate isomerase
MTLDPMHGSETSATSGRRPLARQQLSLGALSDAVHAELERWRGEHRVARLWAGDATLWTGGDEDRWLGWLHVLDHWREQRGALHSVAEIAHGGRFGSIVVLGMGGSSLCPDVLSQTFPPTQGFPRLRVLDSTVPSEIRTLEASIELERTLFIASSKSGSTIETSTLKDYFLAKLRERLGEREAGARFIAITDPGSAFEASARREHFVATLPGVPSIGGRFSALSAFGLGPAAAAGIDVDRFIERTEPMIAACANEAPEQNPGVALGIALGVCALRGIDKLTFVCAPAIASLGAWLEQLIAESTGKRGRGIVPVADEELTALARYGDDRLFVYLRVDGDASPAQDRAVAMLASSGKPVVRIELAETLDLGQELFRWEIATAVAGAVLGIHPFEQPDVEAAKIAARELMSAFEREGTLPEPAPRAECDGLQWFAEKSEAKTADALLQQHLASLGCGDYFAITAYIERNVQNTAQLQAVRHAVRDARRVATTLGFGPRFLHSTGQLHKGGAANGVFLQITADDTELAIPGRRFGFGVLNRAQAQGDYRVLAERGRRLVRVHLGHDVHGGLERLQRQVQRALRA